MEPVHVVAARSVAISASATLLAATWSVPLAYALASRRRPGPLLAALEALVGVPTVLVGLLLYTLLSKTGPLGFLGLLYTPHAIIVGEAILVTPLLATTAYRALAPTAGDARLLAETFGAGSWEAAKLALAQAAPGVAGSLAMAFSRAIGELGVALIVGGNIEGVTRTLSTSIALATAMGEYETAIRLGAVLATLSLGFAFAARAATWLAQR